MIETPTPTRTHTTYTHTYTLYSQSQVPTAEQVSYSVGWACKSCQSIRAQNSPSSVFCLPSLTPPPAETQNVQQNDRVHKRKAKSETRKAKREKRKSKGRSTSNNKEHQQHQKQNETKHTETQSALNRQTVAYRTQTTVIHPYLRTAVPSSQRHHLISHIRKGDVRQEIVWSRICIDVSKSTRCSTRIA